MRGALRVVIVTRFALPRQNNDNEEDIQMVYSSDQRSGWQLDALILGCPSRSRSTPCLRDHTVPGANASHITHMHARLRTIGKGGRPRQSFLAAPCRLASRVFQAVKHAILSRPGLALPWNPVCKGSRKCTGTCNTCSYAHVHPVCFGIISLESLITYTRHLTHSRNNNKVVPTVLTSYGSGGADNRQL